MPTQNETAGRLPVEPVGEGGISRQAEAKGLEIVLETHAALGAAMDREARRLVDNQHQSISIEQPRSCFFGRHEDIGSRTRSARLAATGRRTRAREMKKDSTGAADRTTRSLQSCAPAKGHKR